MRVARLYYAAINLIMAPAMLLHEATHYVVAYHWLDGCSADLALSSPARLRLQFAEETPLRAAQTALLAPLFVGLVMLPTAYQFFSLSPLGVYLAGSWAVYTATGVQDFSEAVRLERLARQDSVEGGEAA